MKHQPSIVLVDAHSLIFQVFHAIRGMTSPSGLPTNAVYGFVRDLLFLRKQKPECLVCAFDREGPTFRNAIDPDYKAHREPPPADLLLQLPMIEQAVAAMNIPVIGIPGYEADDVLATLATAADKLGKDVLIVTSDKDCRQLINDNVKLYSLRKHEEFGRAELLADWGITPEQVVDLQALVGDSVDNVRGVPGIGVKTAAKLLQDFGTLEGVLANVDKISGAKRQENLRNCGPIVALSRKLVRLATDVPIALDWDAWRLRPMNVPRVLELFREWGFQSIAGQVREEGTSDGLVQTELFDTGRLDSAAARPRRVSTPAGGEVAARDAPRSDPPAEAPVEAPPAAAPADWQATYHLVDTQAKLAAVLERLQAQKRFAIDLETTSLQPHQAEIVGVALAWQPGEAHYLAIRGPAGAATLGPAALAALRPILGDPALAKVNQNIKYDLLVLRARGIELAGVAGDPMVADYLLHAGERSHSLDELARRYLQHTMIPITDLIGKKSKNQPQLLMDQVAPAKVAEYAGEDADAAWRLTELLEADLDEAAAPAGAPGTAPRAQRSALRALYDDVEIPLIDVLAELEFNGIRLDVPRLRQLSDEMAGQLATIERDIYALAGHEFNIGSLPQLRKVLFDELKLPTLRKTGITGAASTDQETLEKLAVLDHPNAALPRKIVEHRQIAKLKGTYVDALPDLVEPKTGRIHASFNQTVAATGRLSSSDPNLQNIPVRREQGQQIRQAFLPEEGWSLLTADYSQIELRLMAHFSGDEAMRQAFAEDRDIHAAVAAQIYGVEEAAVDSAMRRTAKTVNFGVIYGISAHGLAQRLGIPRDDAGKFIDAYFARYPKVEAYQQKLLEACRQSGYVTTILGRRRRIEGVRAKTGYQQRNQPEREAINMEIQGSAADLIKLAMLNLHRRLKSDKRRARMLLTVHDELVFEVPPDELGEVAAVVREEMTTPLMKTLRLEVPLKVDVGVGLNWLDIQEIPSA